jgi:phage repressor protein C with HTH and peptisase S24 domain
MLTHKSIWAAIDALAQDHGLSVSGLAKRAGLDPTTFNKSKRISRDGKPRWPSTESVAKILNATGSTLPDLVAHIASAGDGMRFSGRRVPVIGMAQAGSSGFFDDAGFPVGGSWDEVDFPDITDPHTYALEISGDSMEPVLREGDIVIVSPAAQVRRGDRVIVRTTGGEVMAKELTRRTATRVELSSVNPVYPGLELDTRDIAWISRIIWVGQS